ncbi:putative phage-tail assembly protein [Buttiauxella gaviniae ATCC 51604]|uniref:Putative phage-tail assembly protein n=1 Tax=Buttiauxella gaviniae ATCC 51604 TaxID=1354253 RepID=A0A1B7HMC9_9ENTR|nr:DUF2514 family protein [Buttiauxella gaviniae]OAT16768.1 putative phage-tail assembly protein [Buttiauxella gaviniae ATCC 51604]
MKTRYQLLIIAFVAAALGGIGYALHYNGYESGKFDDNQAWNIKWAERDGKDLLELAGRQEQERTEEQRRQNEINQVTADAQTQLDKARLDAAHAEHSADQLQLTITNIRRQLAASETSKLSSAATAGAARATATDMFAQLLIESDKAAGEYAAAADRARIAGLACERSYDAVVNHAE